MSEYILVLVNLLLVLIEFATFIILLSAFFNIEKTTLHRFLVCAVGFLIECIVIGILSDFAAVFLLDRFEYQQQEMVKNRILQQEIEVAKNSIATLTASYLNERKLTYYFQEHITVIRGMLDRDASATEILSYLNGLDGQIQANLLSIATNRMVADIILNQKYQVACRQGTAFRIQMNDLSKFPLPDDERVVALSNLIDNALEACGKIDQADKRYVLVKSRIFCDEAMLYIANPTAQPVKIRDRHILTTKKDSLRHGYGLKNVLAISAAHGGDCAFHYDNRVFSCVLRFDIEV